jgi:hypothetical protein
LRKEASLYNEIETDEFSSGPGCVHLPHMDHLPIGKKSYPPKNLFSLGGDELMKGGILSPD